MMNTNEDYIQEYITSRGLKNKTETSLRYTLNHYSQYQKMTLHDLIMEADMEEEKGIRWKRRKLKQRLTNYMNYCRDTMALSSAKTYVGKVKGFYNHHEIEIGKLPSWNTKNANISEPIKPDDLPTKEIIIAAIDKSNPLMKAIILSLVSTGLSRVDLLSLTIGDFLTATHGYHHKNTIQEALPVLLERDDVIPCFEMRRTKNNKYFFTFMTPETVTEICNYLIIRDKRNHKYHRPQLQPMDKLFKISDTTYGDKFVELNNALGLGKKGTYNRLRGHMLRKFHATQLEKHGMSREHIRTLQGKSNSRVDEVYFYADTGTLRQEYIKAMAGVLIFTEVKEINAYSEEYQLLLEENTNLKNDLQDILGRIEKLEKSKPSWDDFVKK